MCVCVCGCGCVCQIFGSRCHTANAKKVVLGPWRRGSVDPMAFAAGRATIAATPSSFEVGYDTTMVLPW